MNRWQRCLRTRGDRSHTRRRTANSRRQTAVMVDARPAVATRGTDDESESWSSSSWIPWRDVLPPPRDSIEDVTVRRAPLPRSYRTTPPSVVRGLKPDQREGHACGAVRPVQVQIERPVIPPLLHSSAPPEHPEPPERPQLHRNATAPPPPSGRPGPSRRTRARAPVPHRRAQPARCSAATRRWACAHRSCSGS